MKPKRISLSRVELLAIFDSDTARAEAKYLDLCRSLRRYFEWARSSDPDDMAQEAILRGLTRLQEGKKITVANPASYFLGIARNLVREGWKERKPEQLEIDELPEDLLIFRGLDPSEQRIYVKECLRELSQEEFDMLVAYTEGKGNEWGLARGLQPGAVRLRVHRLRKRIDDWVKARAGSGTKKV
jgi:DNA-directed RNA polymerase specialized sigma24 family protein